MSDLQRQQLDKQRLAQKKLAEQMQAQLSAGAKLRQVWDKRKQSASAFIDVSVFKAGLGPAFDEYRTALKGGYDLMIMHGRLEDKALRQVEARKVKLEKALKTYRDLAVAGQKRPNDKLTQGNGKGKIDVASQKKVWQQIQKDVDDIKGVSDMWWKNLAKTIEQYRKEIQGEYRLPSA